MSLTCASDWCFYCELVCLLSQVSPLTVEKILDLLLYSQILLDSVLAKLVDRAADCTSCVM